MGAAMTRFDSNLFLTGLIMIALLLLCLMVVRSVGQEKGGRAITVSEHSTVRIKVTPENGRVIPDIGVADLRGSLP